MKFLYYLAAFGSPNFELKLSYLKNNLEYIYNNIGEKFDIILNNYDNLPEMVCFVKGDVIPRHCGEEKFSKIIFYIN